MKPLIKTVSWVTVFSIAMGFMETVVVVYLRKIYYPAGFQFPLVAMENDMVIIEILREAATIIMLLGIGYLAGKTTSQKFAFFILAFAIWDICYYLFLKLLLNWPESLFTWDILFLIPVPWVGPVIAPCMVSLKMIVLTLSILYFKELGINTQIKPKEWILLTFGSLTVIVSFIWDFFKYFSQEHTSSKAFNLTGKNVEIMNYIPGDFNWWIFIVGQLTIISGIIIYILRMQKEANHSTRNV
ncbi:MAG TPA: hypothetical protein PKD91_03555 [Bacteroidia bacterium]|nr:hypothetical protein [Bacteroidia bacterium]